MAKNFPSAQEIIDEAIEQNPKSDINQLHSLTFELMKKYRDLYYPRKVTEFLSRPRLIKLSKYYKNLIEEELLKPIEVEGKVYTNFMEESARRISQTFQPISGNLAELCVEVSLERFGLRKGIHYRKKPKGEHTDFIVYHPNFLNFRKSHRVEVKNVSLRERTTRGLLFDGDSLVGFFNNPSEFTKTNIKIISDFCKKTGGFSYIPPKLIDKLGEGILKKRFKSNEAFAEDMLNFVKKGFI